ncbi:hypothetical protein ALC62_10798 [Cyphomyrmex costatus]|uniref:Uncharacterized protein n=1 Tax=Cyphomyrmex costatus TaxID=456900 RepID=A0A195CCA5_9HYME|nr:hypothetical protein ALC62_10798 [Cyphomyrmex costatus]
MGCVADDELGLLPIPGVAQGVAETATNKGVGESAFPPSTPLPPSYVPNGLRIPERQGGWCETLDISAYNYTACFAMFDIRGFNNTLATWGAAAASRVYVDALSRLARQAQLGTWGGSKDVVLITMSFKDLIKMFGLKYNKLTLFRRERGRKIYIRHKAIAVRLIVAFFGATAQNHGLKFYGGGVGAADRVNAL